MCGLIGFIPKNNKSTTTGKAVIEQYQRQLSRGQRGFGLMSVFKDNVVIDRATEPTKIMLDTYMSQAPIKFFHHRLPTSTENEMEQTHPFFVSHDELKFNYLLTHNGVIRNAEELLKKHTEELGYTYSTLKQVQHSQWYTSNKFNDSEALAIEAARYFEGKTKEIGALGTIAFIMVKMNKQNVPLEIIWGRNGGNPIELVETAEGLLIASEVYHDDAELVPENTFETLNLKKYFERKSEHKSVLKMISTNELKFAVPPPPAPVTPYVPKPATSTAPIGYAQTITPKTETNTNVTDYSTPREKAFTRMAIRVIEDMQEKIFSHFEDLAYGDVSETEVVSIANDLMELLLEKGESAKEKVRPFFDRREDAEMFESIGNESPNDDYDDDENDSLVPYSSSLSISARVNESRKRFEDIID